MDSLQLLIRFLNDNINKQNYRQLTLEPFINNFHDNDLRRGLSQQDKPTAQTGKATLQYLKKFFSDQLISKGTIT